MSKADRLAKGIYWDRSWNPFSGCSPVGNACINCWARRMAYRLKGRCGYPADEPFRPTFHPERLNQVNSKQKPQVIALSFMSDPFHEAHELDAICWVLDKIVVCLQHTFIALTKRFKNMQKILEFYTEMALNGKPIPNLIGGVSVWDQESADKMIPILLETNLATRIVSLEPCLGMVDFSSWPKRVWLRVIGSDGAAERGRIDGVILGSESGPGARPMHPDWARSVRDQCQEAGVPFFFKQWGEWAPGYNKNRLNCCISNYHSPSLETVRYQRKAGRYVLDDPICMEPNRGAYGAHSHPHREQCEMMSRIGKKTAGRTLDGRTWDDLPGATK